MVEIREAISRGEGGAMAVVLDGSRDGQTTRQPPLPPFRVSDLLLFISLAI